MLIYTYLLPLIHLHPHACTTIRAVKGEISGENLSSLGCLLKASAAGGWGWAGVTHLMGYVGIFGRSAARK